MKTLIYFILLALFTSCSMSESTTFNADLSGTKLIEIELEALGDAYEEANAEGKTLRDPAPLIDVHENTLLDWLIANYPAAANDIRAVDEIFGVLSNVDGYVLDTVGSQYLQVSYSFPADGVKIADRDAYDRIVARMSPTVKWYFKYSPNMLERQGPHSALWKVIDVNLFDIDYPTYERINEELPSVGMMLTLRFDRKIKKVSSDDVMLSLDGHTIKYKVDLEKILSYERDNAILITFED